MVIEIHYSLGTMYMKITRCLIIIQWAFLVISQDFTYLNDKNEELEHLAKLNSYHEENTARTVVSRHRFISVFRNTRNGKYSFGYMDEETITNDARVRVKIAVTFAVNQIRSHSLHGKTVRIELKYRKTLVLDFLLSEEARQFVGRTFDASHYRLKPELNFVLNKLTRLRLVPTSKAVIEKTIHEQVNPNGSPMFVKFYEIDGDGELLCVFRTINSDDWQSARIVFPTSLVSYKYEENSKAVGLAVVVREKTQALFMVHFENANAARSFRAGHAALFSQPITSERLIENMIPFMKPETADEY